MCLLKHCYVACDTCDTRVDINDRLERCKAESDRLALTPPPAQDPEHKVTDVYNVEIVRYELCPTHKAQLIKESGGYRYTCDANHGVDAELEE